MNIHIIVQHLRKLFLIQCNSYKEIGDYVRKEKKNTFFQISLLFDTLSVVMVVDEKD